jgi:hypothetical protein
VCQKDDQKELFRRSRFLQQEAVRLQKDLEKAVSGQAAIAELGTLAGKPARDKIRTAPAGQSGRDPADDRSGWSPASAAELQMLLVKVRVSMKNLKEIGRKSREVNEQLQSIRDEISAFVKNNSGKLRSRQECKSDYYQNKDGTYTVFLKILAPVQPMLELKFVVPDKKTAQHIYKNWESKASDLYSAIYETLVD